MRQIWWFDPAAPLASADRNWPEAASRELLSSLGTAYFARRATVLPKPEYFPDKFRGEEVSVERLVARVCAYLEIPAHQLEFTSFPSALALLIHNAFQITQRNVGTNLMASSVSNYRYIRTPRITE